MKKKISVGSLKGKSSREAVGEAIRSYARSVIDWATASEAEIGPDASPEAIRALGDHLVEFIGESARVFFRRPMLCGEIPLAVGPDFTLGDLANFRAALLGRRPLERKGWEVRVHAAGEDQPVVCFSPAVEARGSGYERDLETVRKRVQAHLARKRSRGEP